MTENPPDSPQTPDDESFDALRARLVGMTNAVQQEADARRHAARLHRDAWHEALDPIDAAWLERWESENSPPPDEEADVTRRTRAIGGIKISEVRVYGGDELRELSFGDPSVAGGFAARMQLSLSETGWPHAWKIQLCGMRAAFDVFDFEPDTRLEEPREIPIKGSTSQAQFEACWDLAAVLLAALVELTSASVFNSPDAEAAQYNQAEARAQTACC